jgi:hypothetical protein
MKNDQKKQLEGQLLDLKKRFALFSKTGNDIDDMLRVIHQPGWTTIAEEMLTMELVKSLQNNLQNIQSMTETLFEASREIVNEHAHA